ncbi:LysR family transcriptional regulator [Shewanella sp. NFH-SH190041]|uniref:LysR family transcriptional regulator n=1 Tax=Shewanella sp. NFH-SH190041 TaxID=2950245 RepID=UPI0021C25CD3|nr:LysR family transcriptional regulator [Shewanella sp. NFH-SH190041]BDM65960.1 LysR family transcriptional regulator [Shewanella sp. NFH-SH190041]
MAREIDFERIDLLSLNIFVLLYENKSATITSKALKIPAPKISRCLKQLRETFGNDLFVRHRYGMHPNEFAEQIYPLARHIVDTASGFSRLDPTCRPPKPEYPIAIPDAISCSMMKPLMQIVQNKTHPISISLELWSATAIQQVLNGDLSFAVLCHYADEALQGYSDKLEFVPIKTMGNLYLLSRAGHPVLNSELGFEQIAQYPFIYTEFGKPEEKTSVFQRFCMAEGIALHTEITIRNVATLIDYLLGSDSLALTSYSSLYDKFSDIPGLHACRLSAREVSRLTDKFPTSNLYLVRRKEEREPQLDWLADEVCSLIASSLD